MLKKAASRGGAERGRQNEQTARNELFAGKDEINIDPSQVPLENQTTDQIVDTAARTHKDTTATAQRALKAVQESKQIQVDTMRKLEEQNHTMQNIGEKMDHMNEELTYAEKLLSYMRRCCCLWVCDACTGADPEEQRKRDWKRRVDRGETQLENGQSWGGAGNGSAATSNGGTAASSRRATAGAAGPATGGRKGDPDIRLPEKYRSTEMQMHEETRKQNDMIDQIHNGLEQLLEGAKVMKDELTVQNENLEMLDTKAVATKDRLDDVNKNSQLRNMARGRPKAKKDDDSILPGKSSLAVEAAKRLAAL